MSEHATSAIRVRFWTFLVTSARKKQRALRIARKVYAHHHSPSVPVSLSLSLGGWTSRKKPKTRSSSFDVGTRKEHATYSFGCRLPIFAAHSQTVCDWPFLLHRVLFITVTGDCYCYSITRIDGHRLFRRCCQNGERRVGGVRTGGRAAAVREMANSGSW